MAMRKEKIKQLVPASIWRYARRRKIICKHRHIAKICDCLIEDYFASPEPYTPVAKKHFDTDRIIWQYWAQGYDDVPEIVHKCFASVDEYAGNYQVIRLNDDNISEYLELPEFVICKRERYSVAHFSDLLRMLLLSTYGGVWLDATVMLSGPMPDYLKTTDYFMFQRDNDEPDKNYWEDTYAYYFGWDKRFRVKVLNSIVFVKKDSVVINALAGLMMKWWKENDSVPDYFFFQILYDVLINGRLKEYKCPIVSDCPPHYMQQAMNDDNFNLIPKNEIQTYIPIHKLTYKESNGKNQR